MRKVSVATALGTLILFAGIIFLPDGEVRAMNVQVNVKDLPAHGVRIISALDPSFDERAQPFFNGQPEAMVSRLRPVFAILENSGSLAIVGSCIRWEILKRDGTTFTRPVSSVNPRALMDGEPRLVQTTMGAAIPPHSIRFFSVFGSAGVGQQLDLSKGWLSFRGSSSEREKFQNALATGDMEEAFQRSEIGKVLAEATSITISIELVFFEDGTFVGDDNSDFFQTVNADINALYDLASEVAVAQNQGRTAEEIVKQVSDVTRPHQQSQYDLSRTPDSYTKKYLEAYKRSRAVYVRALIGMRDTLGAKAAVADKLELLDKPRKKLKKVMFPN